jgi:hypothetical protein
MGKKQNSVAKKIFCTADREFIARRYRSEHHPDFNVIVDHNCNPNWLYIVLENGKIYHHFVGNMTEDKPCQIH